LCAQVILSDTGKGILQNDLSERVQIRFTTHDDRNLGFKKKIQLASKWTLRTARAFGNRLDAPACFRAPRNNQAGLTKLAFSQNDGGG
jgi:hypothetical protein